MNINLCFDAQKNIFIFYLSGDFLKRQELFQYHKDLWYLIWASGNTMEIGQYGEAVVFIQFKICTLQN